MPYRLVTNINMILYNAPRDAAGNKQYVPVVMPTPETFTWYLIGYHKCSNSITEALAADCDDDEDSEKMIRPEMVNANAFNIFTIDSTRFNAVLPNDKIEDGLSDEEVEKFFTELNDKISGPDEKDGHKENLVMPENSDITKPLRDFGFFSVECPGCNLPYTFKTINDIPKETFKCQCCGRTLIHYTGISDQLFTYDNGAY